MKASLLDFILDIGTLSAADIAEHLREHPLQRVVAHLLLYGVIAVVADVEGGAIEVARVVGGIAIMALQSGHIVLGAQNAGNDELIEGHTLHVEAVVEGLANVLQEHGGTGHEVRNGAVELVDMIVRTLADIHQIVLALLSLLTILHGAHAILVGSHNLRLLQVGEGVFITRHAIDAMLL